MRQILLAAFAALVLAASVANAQPESFTCQPGQHVPDSQPGIMRLSVFAVWDGLAVSQFVDKGAIVGFYAFPLLKATISGQVQHWDGHGQLVYRISNVNEQAMPQQLAYLGGKNICQGMAPVKKLGHGVFEVVIPINGGEQFGYASVIVPTAALKTPHHRAWVCVQTDFPLAYAPKLTSGPYKGQPDTLCGLPGSTPGTTALGEAVEAGKMFELFPLIAKRGQS